MQVIPAINARSFDEARAMIMKAVQFLPAGAYVHIDVADGTMTPNITWGNAEEFKSLAVSGLNIEVHLMVKDWQAQREAWCATGAGRIIVPVELLGAEQCAADLPRLGKAGIMPSISINTSHEAFQPFFGVARQFQILAVPPGFPGQLFGEEAFSLIAFVRERAPDAILEVDGGITPAIAHRLKAMGVDSVVSASYIFNNEDPAKAYKELTGC